MSRERYPQEFEMFLRARAAGTVDVTHLMLTWLDLASASNMTKPLDVSDLVAEDMQSLLGGGSWGRKSARMLCDESSL